MDTYEQVLIRLSKAYVKIAALEAERDALRADAERYEEACFDAVMALAHASERYPVYNEAYERVSAAIAAKEPK